MSIQFYWLLLRPDPLAGSRTGFLKLFFSPLPKTRAGSYGTSSAITGGGFIDNIPRVLPTKLDCVIRRGTWVSLPVFDLIQRGGKVDAMGMYQVFNMGIGMVAVVAADKADVAVRTIKASKHKAWIFGEIKKGTGKTRVA